MTQWCRVTIRFSLPTLSIHYQNISIATQCLKHCVYTVNCVHTVCMQHVTQENELNDKQGAIFGYEWNKKGLRQCANLHDLGEGQPLWLFIGRKQSPILLRSCFYFKLEHFLLFKHLYLLPLDIIKLQAKISFLHWN